MSLFEIPENRVPRMLPITDGLPLPTHPQDVMDLIDRLHKDPFYAGNHRILEWVTWVKDRSESSCVINSEL